VESPKNEPGCHCPYKRFTFALVCSRKWFAIIPKTKAPAVIRFQVILRRILMRLIWLLTLPFIIVGEPILHHTTL
jgi:hypothetical protein